MTGNNTKITLDQSRDTGEALVLVLLLAGLYSSIYWIFKVAVLVLILNMIWPRFFRPAARLWFGFSRLLGGMVSKVLLSTVFFLLVTPVGLIRQALGKDPMKLKRWRADSGSVFHDRDKEFSSGDLRHPF